MMFALSAAIMACTPGFVACGAFVCRGWYTFRPWSLRVHLDGIRPCSSGKRRKESTKIISQHAKLMFLCLGNWTSAFSHFLGRFDVNLHRPFGWFFERLSNEMPLSKQWRHQIRGSIVRLMAITIRSHCMNSELMENGDRRESWSVLFLIKKIRHLLKCALNIKPPVAIPAVNNGK